MSKYHQLLLLTIALVIVAVIVIVKVPMKKGLDLAGGSRVVLQADFSRIRNDKGQALNAEEKSSKMDAVIKTVRLRVEGAVAQVEVNVQKQGDDRVIVELPGLKDRKVVFDTIRSTAQLEFYPMKYIKTERNPSGVWEMMPAETDANGVEIYSFRNISTGEVIRGDNTANQKKILIKVVNAYDPIDNPSGDRPMLTGADLEPASKSDLQNGQPIVSLKFNKKGTDIFADYTRRHVGDVVAIFLGGRIVTAPSIREAIPSGTATISGGFATLEEAERTAQFLNTGALPVPLTIVALDDIQATLGTETVNQALLAGILGLACVVLFMLVYYRLPGLLADFALAIYAVLTFAAYKAFGITMTLPGLAGFILSIGMAVDANILIFERLKEELGGGKTLRAAIDAGFARAFTAIFDSNMCTVITAAVLMWYGTGTVKSFAFTLAIGVLISLFTAILVTRTFLHLLVGHPSLQNPWLYGLGTSWFHKWQPNIVRRRNWFFALSALVIVPGLVFYALNVEKLGSGLKPGIEFKPGTSMQVSFDRAVTQEQIHGIVAAALNDKNLENTVQLSNGSMTAFIRTDLLPGSPGYLDKTEAIRTSLTKEIGPIKDVSEQSIGPVVSKELTTNAFWAVIMAAALIVLYLSGRFAIGGFLNGLKYGVCAIVATLHDVLVITGLFAIAGYFLGWEIDTLFVTAVLTMIGFSTHDTIVVFDRIRENLRHRLKGEDYEALTNRSILQTFSRSINTSFTVLITIIALTALGGPIIRHFYIALLVGIVSGTYSSIFNATPLLVVWEGIANRSRAGAAKRKAIDDRPMVPSQKARELKPVAEAGENGEAETDAGASASDASKVKPKRKKRRY